MVPIYCLIKAYDKSKAETEKMLRKAIREKTPLSDFNKDLMKGTVYLIELDIWNLMTCFLFYDICNLVSR